MRPQPSTEARRNLLRYLIGGVVLLIVGGLATTARQPSVDMGPVAQVEIDRFRARARETPEPTPSASVWNTPTAAVLLP